MGTDTHVTIDKTEKVGDAGDAMRCSGHRPDVSQGLPSTANPWGWRAIDPAFDQIVVTLAARAWPNGFAALTSAPDSLEALNDRLAAGLKMAVWSGASGATIYGSPDVNYAFRAWHDWHHWKGQQPFTFIGEAAVAYAQVKELQELMHNHPEVRKWSALVYAEVVGQAIYAELNGGKFPDNQRLFVKRFIEPLLDADDT